THHLVDYYGYLMRAAREPSYRIWQLSHVWWAGNRRSDNLYHVEAMKDADYANPAKVRGALPLHDYIRQGYQYAVISSTRYDRYLKEDWGQRFPGVLQFYRDVMAHGTLLHEVAPAPHLRRGPTIRIYRLPLAHTANGDRA
ncbi:hypothetical protein HQ576_07650, partial [bacterium]|nr:hypothetical protein [bacterium]